MWKVCDFLCLVVILLTPSLANAFYVNDQLEKDEIIKAVNNAKTTWTAGRNFHPSLKSDYSKNLLGQKEGPNIISISDPCDCKEDIDLPESFDAREKWRNCKGLQTVRDQGRCGSCWGRFNGQLSAMDVLSCDLARPSSRGCIGGFYGDAFNYFEAHGIVTGGDYNSHEGCKPYYFRKCDHNGVNNGTYGPCSDDQKVPPPECRRSCSNKEYKHHSYNNDLHFMLTVNAFNVSNEGIKCMQSAIYKTGPLVASFEVYEDFFSYSSGVYYKKFGKSKGHHAVKVIGWGVENGTDYWLVANSWNEQWGDKGHFKIRRGTNECGFEIQMAGGLPKLRQDY